MVGLWWLGLLLLFSGPLWHWDSMNNGLLLLLQHSPA